MLMISGTHVIYRNKASTAEALTENQAPVFAIHLITKNPAPVRVREVGLGGGQYYIFKRKTADIDPQCFQQLCLYFRAKI